MRGPNFLHPPYYIGTFRDSGRIIGPTLQRIPLVISCRSHPAKFFISSTLYLKWKKPYDKKQCTKSCTNAVLSVKPPAKNIQTSPYTTKLKLCTWHILWYNADKRFINEAPSVYPNHFIKYTWMWLWMFLIFLQFFTAPRLQSIAMFFFSKRLQ